MRKKREINFSWLTGHFQRHPAMASAVTGIILIFALLFGLSFGLNSTRSAPVDPTITLYESVGGGGMTVVGADMLDWDIVDHPAMGYDTAYTYSPYDNLANGGVNRNFHPTYPVSNRDNLAYAYRDGTSGFWNGTPTPKHVVMDGSTVRFMGYQYGVATITTPPATAIGPNTNNPPMDSFFTSKYQNAFDAMTFTIRPSNLVPHTFREAGFLFNGSFYEDYNPAGTTYNTTRYTGYQLVLVNNPANSAIGSPTFNLYLFYCGSTTGVHTTTSGAPMHRNNFNPGTTFTGGAMGTTSNVTTGLHRYFTTLTKGTSGTINNAGTNRTLLGTYRSFIDNDDTTPIDIRLEREPSGAFRLYVDGALVRDEPAPYNMNSTAHVGFGFYTGYYGGHNCPVLTVCQFDNVTFTGKFDSVKGTCRVQFRELGTNLEIADDQTEEDWVGTRFRVDPLSVIDFLDGNPPYIFVHSEPPDLDPLQLKRDEQVITLYYERQSKYVSKHASVNGVPKNGSPVDPAHLSMAAPNNIVDYRIDINNDGPPMTVQPGTPVTYAFNDPAASLSNSYNRWAATNGANLTDTLTGTLTATAYQSEYELRASGTPGTVSGTTFHTNAVEMELTGVPPGLYTVYADCGIDVARNPAGLLATTANGGLVRGMASDSPILAPPPPDAGLINTWGSQLATFTLANNTAVQPFNYPNLLVGTVAVDASGKAYVSLGMFAPRGGTAMGLNNTITSNVYLRSVTLVPGGLYTFTSGSGNMSYTASHWNGGVRPTLGARTTPASTVHYESSQPLNSAGGAPSPNNGGFAHIVEAALPNVPAGNYKVFATFSVGVLKTVTAQRLAGATARAMVGSSSNIGSPPSNPSTSSTWGEQVLTCTLPAANSTAMAWTPNTGYHTASVGVLDLSAPGTAYVAVGAFLDCIAIASGNTITSNIRLQSIELVPLDKFELTDVLPQGLQFVPGSAIYTDDSGTPVNVGLLSGSPIVTTAGGVDTINWEFTALPAGITSFHFKAQAVGAAPPSTQNMYVNSARFFDVRTAKFERTNRTYHTNRFVIAETFRSFDDPSLHLRSTTYSIYNPATTYYPGQACYADIVRFNSTGGEFRTWRYYGYSLDNDPTIHPGEPPEEIWYTSGPNSNGWNPVSASHTIHFYFVEDVKVTVRYVDKNDPAAEIKPPVSMLLPARRDWDLSVSHMRPFDYWVYQGHTLDGGPYTLGLYRLGHTYDAIDMVIDHEIVLFFLEEFDYLPPVKNAFVNNSGVPANGEDGKPELVPNNSPLSYQIDVYNSHYPYPPESQLEFDVVFVLDWSASMGGAANNPTPAAGTGRMAETASTWLQARTYGATMIRDMSNTLFATHPGSRISVIAANAGPNLANGNNNNPAFTNLQMDTSFVDVAGFTPAFEASLLSLSAPVYQYDDSAQFLRAAIDKLAGDDSVLYGSNNMSLAKNVNVRSTFTNIPVIVMISDFQMSEPYWSDAMKAQADHFSALYPHGILLTVRLDHDQADQTGIYSGTAYDDLMEQYLAPAGRKGWAFKSIGHNTLYADALQETLDLLEGNLPIPGPLVVTDIVPEGLILDEASISHDGVYNPVTREIKWVLSYEPKGMIPLTYKTTVGPADNVFENTANVLWPTGEQEDTNTTYHRYYPATKNAYINGSAKARNGRDGAPFMVWEDDEITYTINLNNKKGTLPRYDVLFVLDWSGSMNSGSMVPSQSARLYAKDLMMDMSEFIFENYPDSRVALLGMNTGPNSSQYDQINNCTDDPRYSHIQLQTDFLGEAQYAASLASINTAFAAPIAFDWDDNAQYLAAGINKLKGLSTIYGSSLGGSYPKPLIPRLDQSRTPVIVHISDFNMTERTTPATRKYVDNKTIPQEGYWSATMKRQADAFASDFPNGILLTVRTDHNSQENFHNVHEPNGILAGWDSNYVYTGFYLTDGFANILYDGYMTTHVTPNFTKLPYGTSYANALSGVKTDFRDKVPAPPGTVVTDVVPEGLEIDELSISHGGTYDPVTRIITWDLSEEPNGAITLTFNITVKQKGIYENTAHIVYGNGTDEDTNTTYHLFFPAVKNAYINGSATAQNGSDGNPVKVDMNDELKYTIDLYNSEIPEEDIAPPFLSCIVIDVVPDGLEIDGLSISHGGTYDPATRTVTWVLEDEPPGYITLSFLVKAKNPALYENTAHIVYIDAYEENTNTTYHLLDVFKLHIRQIVVDPLSGLSHPVMGYFTLLNGGAVLPLTSDSVTPGYPFTDYFLKPDTNMEYTLTAIVPQYYEFVGHMQNDGDIAVGHPTASPLTGADTVTLNGDITLSYTNTGEIWITVYIKPKGTPGNHQTGVATNSFGKVYKIH